MSKTWQALTTHAQTFPNAAGADPDKTLMAFDFDGTLAPIVQRPEDARIVEASAKALAHLADTGIQIAIISGRPVDTIVELADAYNQPGLRNALIFGQYGAESLNIATGQRHIPEPPANIADAKAELQEVTARHPGAYFEDKGLAIAAHVRETANPDEVFLQIEEEARVIAARHNLTVEPGRYVWELRGATVTKGDALAALIEELKPEAIAFAGDDLGDLAAIAVLEDLREDDGGVEGAPGREANNAGPSIASNGAAAGKTGTRATHARPATCVIISGSKEAPELQEKADVLCDGPKGVADWLEDLVAHIRAD